MRVKLQQLHLNSIIIANEVKDKVDNVVYKLMGD
jgi:hypothetical protein